MKFFLGLDIALANNGVCLLDEESNIVISKVIETKSSDVIEYRIESLCNEVTKIIDEYENHLDRIYLEGVSYGSNGRTFSQICGMHYSLRYILYTNYVLPVHIVEPTKLKKYITGKGNCRKDLILLNVYKKYGVEFDDDNLADAFVLAMMAFEEYQQENSVEDD